MCRNEALLALGHVDDAFANEFRLWRMKEGLRFVYKKQRMLVYGKGSKDCNGTPYAVSLILQRFLALEYAMGVSRIRFDGLADILTVSEFVFLYGGLAVFVAVINFNGFLKSCIKCFV